MQRSLISIGIASSERTSGTTLDVARILRHVGDEHRLAMQRGVTDDALAEPDARHVALLAVLHRDLDLELAVVVEEQDAERAVVDHAAW